MVNDGVRTRTRRVTASGATVTPRSPKCALLNTYMKKISRQEAMKKELMYYFSGKPCSKGHTAKRRVTNSTCYECELKISKEKRNSHTKREYDAKYHRENWHRIYNPEKAYIRYTEYRARLKSALPIWYKQEAKQIRSLYREAKRLTEDTGVQHHVDHIVPLSGEAVCGLHCFANLQVIPAINNLRKGNKF